MTFGTEDGKAVELLCPVLRDDGRTARNALSANGKDETQDGQDRKG